MKSSASSKPSTRTNNTLKNLLEGRIFLTSIGKFYFDSHWYRKQYRGFLTLHTIPLFHFLTQGLARNCNPNPFFDSQWYCEQYPNAKATGLHPIFHYIKQGIKDQNSPHPFFDVEWYLKTYKDVEETGIDPLLHFLTHGITEARNPNPYFDSHWYQKKYLKDQLSTCSPLEHYLTQGEKEGKNPHPYLDIPWYLNDNPELVKSGMSPLLHYMEIGAREERDPNPYFDSKWYKKEYSDVTQSGLSPLRHYLEHGIKEQRNPSEFFDTKWYLLEYPDVPHHGMEALYHYLQHGEDEGRKTFFEATIPAHCKVRGGLPSSFPINVHSITHSSKPLHFDIVLVTYNSSKWIDNCLKSLLIHDQSITVTIVDNGSTDDTIGKLEQYQDKFSSLTIHQNTTNLGFGAANNLGAQLSQGHYLVFLNIDTELHDTETFKKLSALISTSLNDIAAWEFRQLPYEHPKCYDPVSLETSWFSGAAVVIRRDAFQQVGGFDEKLFMYCEDVDLSWRLRAHGYRLLYCPFITITHHSYREPGEVKPIAQIYGVKHNYFLRCRFGTGRDRRVGQSLLLKFMRYAKDALSHDNYSKLIHTEDESLFFKQSKVVANHNFVPLFDQFEYEIAREGGFYVSESSQQTSTVSIIIRTIGNLQYLEKAIYSVVNQTYKNIELIVVEDGSKKAQDLVSQFKDFNIVYKPVKKMGRCNAGNVGLASATGDYFNFLDEDDLLFCDHVETLINAISSKPKVGAVWASAFSIKTEISKDTGQYYDREYTLAHTLEPDSETILLNNFFPIQAVLFRRECFDNLGGFDPEITLLEDWDVWIRYLKNYKFIRVEKTTSLYRVPYNQTNYSEREDAMQEFYKRVQKKHA